MLQEYIVHDRTLVGAIDSYLGALVHVRPFLASTYRTQLEMWAEHWIAAEHPNAVAAVSQDWISSYLATVANRTDAEAALCDFYAWAVRHQIVDASPLV